MERILWVGDAVVPTGFARVTHSIIEHLKDTYEFHVLGVNHYGDPHDHDYSVYPAILNRQGEPYGFSRVAELVERLEPSILVLFNDTWIIDSYLRALRQSETDISNLKIMVYFPVDHENIDPRFFKEYKMVDTIATYTEFGKEQFTRSFSRLDTKDQKEAHVIPHGIDLETFHELDMMETRDEMYDREDKDELMDSFVIMNANRNSPRKRYDIFLHAFHLFQKDKSDVRVYCHCGMVDEGIDIVRFVTDYGFKDKLLVTSNKVSMPGVSDAMLNKVYNFSNIGVNTTMGEGWGLVSFEHAATMKPQIVPAHSACLELWEDMGIVTDILNQPPHIGPKLNAEFRVPDTHKVVEALEEAYEDWKNGGKTLANLAKNAYKTISKHEYSWEFAANRFDKLFKDLL